MNYSFGFREVTPYQAVPPKWTEFTLNTGGTQSTLQDFKVAEKKGGYSYKDQKKYYTRNRFIYWRVRNDVVEFHEQSLDISLTGNCVRYTFADTPVLDGITVWEVPGTVLVLVPTVSSVHRLSFPHPDLMHSREHSYPRGGTEYTAPSIFAEASLSDARNPISFHVINTVHSSGPPPHASASGLSPNEEDCLFALANASGSILLVRLNAMTGSCNVNELSEHSDALMPRFLSRALRGKNNEDAVAVSLTMHATEDDTILLALCRDGNIRAWSTSRHNCSIITRFDSNLSQGAQNHAIKKAVGSGKQLWLGILHCFVSHSIIHILEASSDVLKLKVVESVPIPKNKDVVDFAVTISGEVWVVLRSAGGETNLALWRNREWQECVLETPWSREEIPMDPDLDAKQIYSDFLFHPGRFSVSVINKALSIYRKANIISDAGVPMQVLKERVCAVVDAEVRGELRERECTADELSQLQASAWQKFCSCVIEYHESGSRPLGLMVLCHKISNADKSELYRSTCEDPSMEQGDEPEEEDENEGEWVTSGIVLIKKSSVSLVRPMDTIESIVFSQDYISRDEGVPSDMIQLISVIMYLDDNLPDDSKMNFDRSLRQLRSPIQTVAELYSKELSMSDDETLGSLDLPSNIAINLEKIQDLESVLITFLDVLDVGQPDLDEAEPLERSRWLLHLGHLYSSQLGISLAAASLSQILRIRYDLCRSLLILEHMLQTKSFQQFQRSPRRGKISQAVVERTAHLTHCYYLLLWVAETPVYPVIPLENVETSVSILKLKEDRGGLLMSRRLPTNNIVTLLHLFLQSTASATVRLILSRQEMPSQQLPIWRDSFLPFLHALTQLTWPVCNNTVFPEFLLFSGQRLLVQEYTRLLSKWCHINSYTRKFIAACSLMDTGEHLKAFDLFNKAAHGVLIDEFLRRRVVRSSDSDDRLLVLYYVQVMKLFEQQGLHDLVVELAETAIAAAKPEEPEIATLHSVAFLHRLELGQYAAAYDAMLANPDAERRRHCLQQLVVTLVDAKKLPILMTFKYDGVRPELERIVEARARSMDVQDNPYYNFLFAYHVQRECMRKAGCVMYEQALRLSPEVTAAALNQQSGCLVAAINCLSLVKAEDAWIVKPVFSSGEEVMDIDEADEELERQVEVLELKDLRKDLAMCQARLKLLSFDPDRAPMAAPSPQELVAVLSSVGLYKDSLKLSGLFGIKKAGVMSALAGACVRLDETPSDAAWDWLRENDADELGHGSASSLAWRLLEVLLMKEEPGKDSSLHKEVTKKLLHLGVFLPTFLVASYKKRNAAELLRLLLSTGRLDEASDLAVEYIEAVLGKGKERFALDAALLPQNPAVWLPLNTIDLILQELETHASYDSSYAECEEKLRKTLDNYIKTATAVSQDKLKLLEEQMVRVRTM